MPTKNIFIRVGGYLIFYPITQKSTSLHNFPNSAHTQRFQPLHQTIKLPTKQFFTMYISKQSHQHEIKVHNTKPKHNWEEMRGKCGGNQPIYMEEPETGDRSTDQGQRELIFLAKKQYFDFTLTFCIKLKDFHPLLFIRKTHLVPFIVFFIKIIQRVTTVMAPSRIERISRISGPSGLSLETRAYVSFLENIFLSPL